MVRRPHPGDGPLYPADDHRYPLTIADLASEALGFNVIAFIQITLATHSPDNAKKFRALVNRVDAIVTIDQASGGITYSK